MLHKVLLGAVALVLLLGLYLASLVASPVYAGNNGVVVFAEPLGIYGHTVILDHGMGVFSSYSHLSQIDAKVGDKVEKGAVLGRTGTTVSSLTTSSMLPLISTLLIAALVRM